MTPYKPTYLPRQVEALNYLNTDSIVEQLLYGWSHTFNQHRPDNDLYKTKEEAFKGGLELLINQLKRRNEEKRYDRIVQILQDELSPVVENQLTLF